MFITMCKSKIHKARITKKELYYEGSIGIDKALLSASEINPYEKVQVVNLNNGERFETYCIPEKNGKGDVVLYGPAARLGEVGDLIIVISYALVDSEKAKALKIKVINVDKNNRVL
ncbi:MAG: aspartate 1-decarboxylase [Candidatus Omnitrophica bacterium]|nr:aspartate 1-decarboxylase [Candidatus Omnitrophota bacterium]